MQNRPPLLVPLNINHPHCLDGLDHWRQLDLLDDDQIKRLCRQGLTCPLPAWEPQSAPASQQPLRAASIPYRPPVTASPATPEPPPRQRSIAQAIKDEFSIRWLLGLGVFVVLISSAVLAASQWGQLPPAGQYGILWLYTLAFALSSFILERRQRLTLTAQTLHSIVLGLIPLNFWAMDDLGLWESPLGWLTLALASLSLTVWLWQESHLSRSQTVLFLLFSLCHWPLSRLPELSQLGLYLATLVGLLRYRQRPQLSLLAVVAYGLGSICVRGLLTDPLVLSNLGLTWGLLGWQVAQTTPPRRGRLGALFFICGWLLSLLNLSWQTLTVTGLALHRLAQRLQRLGQPPELLLTALVALQGYFVLLQLLPDSLLEALWQNLETLFTVPSWQTFVAVLSLPYLLGLLWLTGWLRHQPSRRYLSQQGDAGIFLLGLGLTLMVTETLSEIWLLWLPLGAVLAVMIQRRYPQGLILANIAQLLLLGGVASLLDWQLEGNLALEQWGLLLLGFALLETLWTQGQAPGVWQTSAWQITQFLGLSSYLILVAWRPSPLPFEESFPLAWLWWLLPFAWGIAARYGVAQYRRSAAWFAIVGAIALQLLPLRGHLTLLNLLFATLPELRPALILSFSLGLLLLLPLAYSLRDRRAGAIAVGFGVFWSGAVAVQIFPLFGQQAFLALSLIPLGLWTVERWGRSQETDFWQVYRFGLRLWGWLTSLTLMASLTLRSVLSYPSPIVSPSPFMVLSLGLVMAAIVIHQGRYLNPRGLYSLGWFLELLAVEIVFSFGDSFWVLALVNIALGLLVQQLGNRWLTTLPALSNSVLSPLHTLPILYGLIALVLRSNIINSWAGVITLGASLILLNVGREIPRWGRLLIYIGFLGLTLGSSELLLRQLSGVGLGDRQVALTLLWIGWMYLYRGIASPLSAYLKLPRRHLHQLAHIHWGLGTVLLSLAATLPINQPPLALISGGLLTSYAILQSRQPHLTRNSRLWLYLGVAQGYGVLSISIAISGTQQQVLPFMGAIAVGLALFLYHAPWSRWGWHPTPWHQVSRLFPATVGVLTIHHVHPLSVLAIALFYGILGRWERQIRWHYLALLALCGLAVQGLQAFEIDDRTLWLAPITLSVLYITRVDPYFQQGQQRSLRHQIRLITLTLFFALSYLQSHWFLIATLSLLVLLAGLGSKVRAFLFVGTAFFIITISEQFIILGATYTLSKWILGLGFGIILISIGALVESRKPQVVSTWQTWQSLLESWE